LRSGQLLGTQIHHADAAIGTEFPIAITVIQSTEAAPLMARPGGPLDVGAGGASAHRPAVLLAAVAAGVDREQDPATPAPLVMPDLFRHTRPGERAWLCWPSWPDR
jgi:hypothetical protein